MRYRVVRRPALAAVAAAALAAQAFLATDPAVAQEPFPSDSALQELLDGVVETSRVTGVVVGLLQADGERRIFASGSGGPGAMPLGGESVFEIGSITKVFTAILLADMALRGEVRLDDPLQQLLPDSVRVPARSGKTITLELMSSHYSALPRLPANMRPADPANPYADYSVEKMYAFLSDHSLRRDPGQAYEYSNYAVGLLGHALALEAGMTYEEALRERILDPLGMDHTAIALGPWMEAHLASGHDPYGGSAANWDLPTLAGAGGLRSTTADMLEFAAANLSSAAGRLFAAMDSTHRPRRQVGEGPDSVALGWHVFRRDGRTITAHNGGTGGYRSFLGLDLEANRAVVVLTNTSGDGLDDVGLHLLVPSFEMAKPAVGPALARAWRDEGVQAAAETYRAASLAGDSEWRLDENGLESFGRWLLREGETADAVVIFELNVESNPGMGASFNGLGDAYRAAGRLEEARDAYARAVEIGEAESERRLPRYRANLRRTERELRESRLETAP